MDAIILFLIGIAIFLFGFILKYIEKKRRSRYRREKEEKLKLIDKNNSNYSAYPKSVD